MRKDGGFGWTPGLSRRLLIIINQSINNPCNLNNIFSPWQQRPQREETARWAHLLTLPLPGEAVFHPSPPGGILSNNPVLLEKEVGTRLHIEIRLHIKLEHRDLVLNCLITWWLSWPQTLSSLRSEINGFKCFTQITFQACQGTFYRCHLFFQLPQKKTGIVQLARYSLQQMTNIIMSEHLLLITFIRKWVAFALKLQKSSQSPA